MGPKRHPFVVKGHARSGQFGCECGLMAAVFSEREFRAWHRQHKHDVVAAATGMLASVSDWDWERAGA